LKRSFSFGKSDRERKKSTWVGKCRKRGAFRKKKNEDLLLLRRKEIPIRKNKKDLPRGPKGGIVFEMKKGDRV